MTRLNELGELTLAKDGYSMTILKRKHPPGDFEMTSAEATEMMFKIRDMLNDKDLNMFMELTSYECGAKMEDVKFCFDMLVKEFTADE